MNAQEVARIFRCVDRKMNVWQFGWHSDHLDRVCVRVRGISNDTANLDYWQCFSVVFAASLSPKTKTTRVWCITISGISAESSEKCSEHFCSDFMDDEIRRHT